jgi:hypothetical protein
MTMMMTTMTMTRMRTKGIPTDGAAWVRAGAPLYSFPRLIRAGQKPADAH